MQSNLHVFMKEYTIELKEYNNLNMNTNSNL